MRCFARSSSAACAIALLLIGSTPASADVVLDWNAIAIRTMTLPPPPPPANPFFQARFMAITQLAVFEAVNSIVGGYDSYTDALPPSPGASLEAAAVSAAYTVLVNYFPGAQASLSADRASSLAAIPD